MKTDTVLLTTFPTAAAASGFTKWLGEHGIPYKVELKKSAFDPSFAFNRTFDWVEVRVPADLLESTRTLLRSEGMVIPDLPQEDTPSYLLEMKEEELMEVVYRWDEWNAPDVAQAEELLRQRGISLTPEEKAELRERRMSEIRKARRVKPAYLIGGMIFAIFGGILGTAIGFTWAFLQRKDPDGNRYPVYDKRSQNFGLLIGITGLVVFGFFIYRNFIRDFFLQ
jgi:hypothetical protein